MVSLDCVFFFATNSGNEFNLFELWDTQYVWAYLSYSYIREGKPRLYQWLEIKLTLMVFFSARAHSQSTPISDSASIHKTATSAN